MAKGKIVNYIGAKNIHVARITQDDADGYDTETPVYLAGLASVKMTTESSTAKAAYDNEVAIVRTVAGAPVFEFEVSGLSNDQIAYITGKRYDETLDVLYHGGKEAVNIALMFEHSNTDGDVYYEVLYNGVFDVPDSEYESEDPEEASAGTGMTLTYTTSNTQHIFTKTGRTEVGASYLAPGGDLTAAKAKLDTFYDDVLTPDTVVENKATTPSA